jgi:sporulation protein YlmC with PRC-barrel domain
VDAIVSVTPVAAFNAGDHILTADVTRICSQQCWTNHSASSRSVRYGIRVCLKREHPMYADTNENRDIARNETATLIASDKVEGTSVYGADSKKIGSIENVMIDKRSGKVAYAVLSFGGFLGMGTDHYPLPWSMLKYDESLGGYIVNLSKERLERAPKYTEEEDWDWSTRTKQLDAYYMAPM